jgi:hypothetical protein
MEPLTNAASNAPCGADSSCAVVITVTSMRGSSRKRACALSPSTTASTLRRAALPTSIARIVRSLSSSKPKDSARAVCRP